jgi:uncharacterized protein (TIGR02246 family)
MATQIETDIRNTLVHHTRTFMETFRRGDSAGMADLYTESGQLLPPNAGIVQGSQAIAGFWAGVMEMGITELDMRVGEVEQHGDTAIEVSSAALLAGDGNVADEIKYIVIWKREDGRWKLHRDIWNSSRPAS